MADTRYPTVPRFQEGLQDDLLRKSILAINGILDGHTNNHFKVTLGSDCFSTIVDAPGVCSTVSSATFSPMSESAVKEEIWIEVGSDSFTVHHEHSMDETRVIGVTIHGG